MIKVSAYTTFKNPLKMDYPFVQSITSMCAFADEVIVLNTGDDSDGSVSFFKEKFKDNPKVKFLTEERAVDWGAPNHGIYDGISKGIARKQCTGDILYQFDLDEVVHELQVPRLLKLIEEFSASGNLILALPVVEYWGSSGKVRLDINPLKPRLSKNIKQITHGIPKNLRTWHKNLMYAKHGTDGCDYIDVNTGDYIPVTSTVPMNIWPLRETALQGNPGALQMYETWFNQYILRNPGVFHYSWFDIERKIHQYRLFWDTFWKALYNEGDKPNVLFPNKTWRMVTEGEIRDYATLLETTTGGHIFHKPFDPKKTTPSITTLYDHPEVMKSWVEVHKQS